MSTTSFAWWIANVEACRIFTRCSVGTSPAVSVASVAAITEADLPGHPFGLSLDQAVAVEKIATSGRVLDVLVGVLALTHSRDRAFSASIAYVWLGALAASVA